MPDYTGLIEDLEVLAEWADENIYEVPINLPDTLKDAAVVIKNLHDRHIKSEIDATNYYGALIQANAELEKYKEVNNGGLNIPRRAAG